MTDGDRIEVAKAKGRADHIPIVGAYAATIVPADARGETTSS